MTQVLNDRSQSKLWHDTHPFPPKLTKQVPIILVYLRSPAPFDYAITACAHPPNFEYLCHWNWFLLPLLIFNLILYFFLIRGKDATGKEQPEGTKVTLVGPKSDIGRAEKSYKGQNITLDCYNCQQIFDNGGIWMNVHSIHFKRSIYTCWEMFRIDLRLDHVRPIMGPLVAKNDLKWWFLSVQKLFYFRPRWKFWTPAVNIFVLPKRFFKLLFAIRDRD